MAVHGQKPKKQSHGTHTPATGGLGARRRLRTAAARATGTQPIGGGQRFAATQRSVAAGLRPGAIRAGQTRQEAAGGIAAAAGRRKLGKKRFQGLAARARAV